MEKTPVVVLTLFTTGFAYMSLLTDGETPAMNENNLKAQLGNPNVAVIGAPYFFSPPEAGLAFTTKTSPGKPASST